MNKRKRLDNNYGADVTLSDVQITELAALANDWFDPSALSLSYENNMTTGEPVLKHRQNERTIEVSPEFTNVGFFKVNTIAQAITNLNALSPVPSAAEPARVFIHAGVHLLSAPVVIPAGVSIHGHCGLFNCVIAATAPMTTMFTLTDNNEISNVMINGNLLVTTLITIGDTFTLGHLKTSAFLMYNESGVKNYSAGLSARILGNGILGQTLSGSLNYLFDVSGVGNYASIASHGVSTGYGFVRSSNGGFYQGTGFFCSDMVGEGCRAESSGTTWISGGNFQNCTGSIFSANTAGKVHANAMSYHDRSNTGKTFDLVSSDAQIFLNACIMPSDQKESTSYFPANKSNLVAMFTDQYLNNTAGFHVYGDVSFGHPGYGSTVYTGQGGINQSKQRSINYNIAGAVTLNHTVTSKIETVANKRVPDENALGSYVVFSQEDSPFSSLVYQVTVIAPNGNGLGNYVVEYLSTSSVWTSINYCVTSYDPPYTNYGAAIYNSLTGVFVLSLDYLLGSITNWTPVNFGSSGVKYHLRVRSLFTAITGHGTIGYIYSLTNCSLSDNLGYTRRFGRSRGYKNLPYDISMARPCGTGAAPTNVDFWFGLNMGIGREFNRMQSFDALGTTFFIPGDADLSSPIKATLTYCSYTSAATQASFTLGLVWGYVTTNALVSPGAGAPLTSLSTVLTTTWTLPVNQTNGNFMQTATISLYMNSFAFKIRPANAVLTDMFCFQMTRTDGNAPDLVLLQQSFSYCSSFDGTPAS